MKEEAAMSSTQQTKRSKLWQNRKEPLFKNSFFLFASYALVSIFGFAFWIIAARFYPASEVGFASALIAATGLLAGFSGLGLGIGLTRFLPREEDKQGMINSGLTIPLLFSIILALIFIAGLDFWSPALVSIRESDILMLIFVIFTIALTLQDTISGVFMAFRCARFQLYQSAIRAVLQLSLVTPLLFAGVAGIFSAYGIALCISVAISLFFLLPKLQPKYRPLPTIRRRVINEIFHFSLGNYIAVLFAYASSFFLPLLVINLLSPEATAYFRISWAVSSVLFGMIPAAIFTSLFAEGSNLPEGLHENATKAIKITFMLIIPGILIIYLFGDKILLLFGLEYAQNGLTLLWLLTLSSVPAAFNQLYITIKRIQKDVRAIISVSALTAIFTLGISYALILRVDLDGIGIGFTTAQVIVSFVIIISLLVKGSGWNILGKMLEEAR